MIPQLLIAATIAATSFGAGWTTNNWRHGAKETKRVKQALRESQESAARNIRRADNVIAAQNAAVAGARVARLSAVAAASELDRLRVESAALVSRSSANLEACIVGADALRTVFDACGKEYAEVAAIAQRHAIDAKALSDARPD